MADSSEHITGKLACVRLDDNDEDPTATATATATAEDRIANALRAGVRDGDDMLWPGEAYVYLFPLLLLGASMVDLPILEQYAYRTMGYIFAHIFPRCGVNVVSVDEIPSDLVRPSSPVGQRAWNRIHPFRSNANRTCRYGMQLTMEDGPGWDPRDMQSGVCTICHRLATKVMHTYVPEDPNKRFVEVRVQYGHSSDAKESSMVVSVKTFGQYFPVRRNESLHLP